MKGKKLISMLGCVSLTAALLTGCGSAPTAAQTDGATETAAKEQQEPQGEAAKEVAPVQEDTADISGTLLIWEHATNFEAPLEAIIEGFSEKYPNVDIEYETKGDTYYSLLTTAIQSGEAPDLFWTNGNSTSNMKDLVANGALMDLTEVVDYSALEENSLKLGEIGGKMYSVPWMSFDTRCCYYNKQIFEKEGWTVPETFSEFESLLEKQKAAGYIPISFCPNNTWSVLFTFEPVLAAMDPEYTRGLADYSVKTTDQPAADGLNKLIEWKEKGYYGENCMGVADGTAQLLAFTTGKAAMTIAGSWDNTTIMENNPELLLGAFHIPAEDGTKGMVGAFANGFSVYNETENPEAAKAFIQYCASLEAQTAWVQTLGAVSGSTSIESVTDIAKEIGAADTTYVSWQSLLANYAKDGESATTLWEEDSPKLFSGDVTVQQMMDEIAAIMQ